MHAYRKGNTFRPGSYQVRFLHWFGHEREHLRSIHIHDYVSPFSMPPAVLVSTKRSWKTSSLSWAWSASPKDRSPTLMPSGLLERNQHPVFDKGGNNGTPYQFTPVPLLRHVAWRCCQECIQCDYMREEALNLILNDEGFLEVGCRRSLSRRLHVHFVITINGRDGPKDSLERTESICRLLCDIDKNGGSPKRRALPVSHRNWFMSGEDQSHSNTDMYFSIPPLACLLPPQCH